MNHLKKRILFYSRFNFYNVVPLFIKLSFASIIVIATSCSSKKKSSSESMLTATAAQSQSLSINEPHYSDQFKVRAHVDDFKKGVQYYNEKKWDESNHFLSLIAVNDLFYPYAEMLRSKIMIEKKQQLQAIENLEKMLKLKMNSKLEQEAQILLADLYLQNHQYIKSQTSFQKAERALRGQPELVFALLGTAQVALILEKNDLTCRNLKKVYSDFPHANVVQHWGPILTENIFLNKKNRCTWDEDLFRSRLRSLIWNGQDSRAIAEIDLLKSKKVFSELILDQLYAIYYAQTGEPFRALEILDQHYQANKNNFEFLNFYAPVAARAGEVKKAVQAYDLAYELSPNKKIGKQALYQAAFLSYQFRDYDASIRKFLNLLRKSPTDKMRRDVLWHLAWIKYLKKDYKEASKDFLRLSLQRGRRSETFASDRLTYWLAMSYLKLNRTHEAIKVFTKLAQDSSYSYYSLAAKDRLEKLGVNVNFEPKITIGAESSPIRDVAKTNGLVSKFKNSSNLSLPFQSIPLASLNGEKVYDVVKESEETELLNQFLQEKIEEDPESQESVVAVKESESTSEETESIFSESAPLVADFGDVHLENQFVLSQSLASLGFKEWSRWSFYELERKLKKPEHLLRLIDQYEKQELTHRSSYIAQVRMSSIRINQGLQRSRRLWQGAYPQAFKTEVFKYSTEYKVAPHLVWAIMRAETQYRKDAISPVGALGLMQVMPYTGYRLANLLNEEEFDPPHLLKPENSIRYGTRYLKKLSDQFDGFIPLIAAGYNGGPHRVNSWLRHFGQLETDEFIEHIPFLETRNYVKKVVANARIYNLLYDSKISAPELIPSQKYLAQAIPVPIPEKAIYSEEWN